MNEVPGSKFELVVGPSLQRFAPSINGPSILVRQLQKCGRSEVMVIFAEVLPIIPFKVIGVGVLVQLRRERRKTCWNRYLFAPRPKSARHEDGEVLPLFSSRRPAARRWYQRHLEHARRLLVIAQATRRRRYVSWANVEAIAALYARAALLTREKGRSHVVDHIIPLKGRTVSGLHVETNLRIIAFNRRS